MPFAPIPLPGQLTDVPPLPDEIAEIKTRAEAANGNQPLNHVGWLYARIEVLFQTMPKEAFRLDVVADHRAGWLGDRDE